MDEKLWAFDLRQAVIDYGVAAVKNDPAAILASSTRGTELIAAAERELGFLRAEVGALRAFNQMAELDRDHARALLARAESELGALLRTCGHAGILRAQEEHNRMIREKDEEIARLRAELGW